jgi:group I intron endonuclease
MLVYSITNKVNGKQYIGITKRSVGERWNGHLTKSKRGSSMAIHAAIRKYGASSFFVEQIASARTWDDLLATEVAAIIDRGTSVPNGYNVSPGGRGNAGYIASPETRAKISIAVRASLTPERCAAISARQLGRKMPESFAPKIRAANKGKVRTVEQRARVSAGRIGMKFTEGHRRNIGLASKGHVTSDETKEKLRAALRIVGREMRGKLTAENVVEIKRRIPHETMTAIGADFGVSKHLIYLIKKGKAWTDIPSPIATPPQT